MENPDMEDEESKAFRIGAAIDCLLTSPSRWEEDFKVLDVVRPSGLMQKFIEALPPGLTAESPLEEYKDAYEESGYKKALPLIVKDLWSKFTLEEYYLSRRALASDQTLLTRDEYEFVVAAKETILSNPFTYSYFVTTEDHIELVHQKAIYFTYRGVECKALLDGLKIDHKNKTIQPFDLKSTSKNVSDFPIAYIEYGYYRQSAFYTIAIKEYLKSMRFLPYVDYELKPFQFVVVQKSPFKQSSPAYIWQTTDLDLEVGMNGGTLKYSPMKVVPGINNLIDDLIWHRKTGK